MTGTRRPTGIPPPSPNRGNGSDEEENSEEEGEDINEGDSDRSGSESSGATTPLTREKSGHSKKETGSLQKEYVR